MPNDSLKEKAVSSLNYLRFLFQDLEWSEEFDDKGGIHFHGLNKNNQEETPEQKTKEERLKKHQDEINRYREDIESIADKPNEVMAGYQNEKPITFDFSQTSNLLIAGHTGSGKSIFVKNIVNQLKSKTNVDPLFFIYDYASKSYSIGNTNVVSNIDELYRVLNKVNNIRVDRQFLLRQLNATTIQSDQPVNIDGGVLINDRLYNVDDEIICKINRNEKDERVLHLTAKEVVNLSKDRPPYYINIKNRNGESYETPLRVNRHDGDLFYVDPIYLVIDECMTISFSENDSKQKAIELLIEKICSLGRSANIHVILNSQRASTFSNPTIKNNSQARVVCGQMDNNSLYEILGTTGVPSQGTIGHCLFYNKGSVEAIKFIYDDSMDHLNW